MEHFLMPVIWHLYARPTVYSGGIRVTVRVIFSDCFCHSGSNLSVVLVYRVVVLVPRL